MGKPTRCHECGSRFVSVEKYERMIGLAGGVGIRSNLFPELCDECEVFQLQREALYENLRRLEEWAKMPGHSRRTVAAALVREFDKNSIGGKQRHHVRWAFIYEMTGDRKELRKLAERLMPVWNNRIAVTDPIMGKTAEALQNKR